MDWSQKKKRLTVMIVPHDTYTDGMRQFNISSSFIRFTWLFLISLVTLCTIGLANMATRIVDQAKLERLSGENEVLRRDVAEYTSEKKKLEERLVRVKELETNLKVLTGLAEGLRKRVGIGGGKGGPGKTSLSLISPDTWDSIAGLDSSLDRMEERARNLELSFEKIKGIVEENEARIAATPAGLPLRGRFSSGFGYRRDPFTGQREFHEGVDINGYTGAPVRATANGKVVYAGWKAGYGLVVEIDHGFGYQTVYGHNSSIKVKKGQRVKRGDIISFVGSTGRSTGPHLHYEVRVWKKAVNPWRYILY